MNDLFGGNEPKKPSSTKKRVEHVEEIVESVPVAGIQFASEPAIDFGPLSDSCWVADQIDRLGGAPEEMEIAKALGWGVVRVRIALESLMELGSVQPRRVLRRQVWELIQLPRQDQEA